jgi:PAS domain S-box-containing protein
MTDEAPAPLRPGRLQPTFGAKINVILGLGLAVLLAVGVFSHRSIGELVQTGRDEADTLAEVGQLEVLLGSMRNAVALQRSYLLTRRQADLSAYREARGRVGKELEALRSRLKDADQLRQMRALGAAVAARLQRLDAVIEAGARLGPAATAEMLKSPAGADLDERIGSIAQEFRREELQALRWRKASTEYSAGVSSYLVGWGTAFACVLLVWAMVSIHRNQAGRLAAERAVKASAAQLRLITDSVPALIGYADRQGRLLFHNRGFEKWFGRAEQSLRGSTLRELFGEEAFRPIEPRVAAVLGGSAVDFNFSFRTPAGEAKDLSAQLAPRRENSGEVSGYYILVTDITALTEVERLKSEFVTTVSHELRTPLTSIRGSLGLIAGGVTGVLPDKARELLAIAMQNCERLVRLVNDILDSERMMSGKMQFNMERFELAQVIERSMRETEGFAHARGVQLRFSGPGGTAVVRADRDRLVQVVTNLLSNACKFSPPGGEVDLEMETLGASVRVSVSDRGPGLPSGSEKQLFGRFVQFDSTDVRRVGGSGLGLNICKGIIERLEGRIGFTPRPGGGSIFFFELPLQQAEVAAP